MYFLQRMLAGGYEVGIPVVDGVWDALISIDDYPWETVQVKRCYPKDGCPTVNLVRADGGRYHPGDVDWLAAVDVDAGLLWLIPFEEVCEYTRKRITSEYSDYLLEKP